MILVGNLDYPYIENENIEIVERKGLGHPDTICDYLSENLSRNLSNYYYKNFSKIYHHNLDKAVLIGGESVPRFGGGEIIKPIEIKIVGRAVLEIENQKIPIEDIYYNSAKKFFNENFRWIDFDKNIITDLRVRPGSLDLVANFNEAFSRGIIPKANDTSFGVGYAPFSRLENLVYQLENYLSYLRRDFNFIGEDIKIMGVRINNKIKITVAMAFVDKFVYNLNDYIEKKEFIREKLLEKTKELTDLNVEININTADIIDKSIVYITVTGTSAEAGDDGQVGRGNRVNGLITPYRPMSLEAAAGKNPISHVGKLYNVCANNIAKEIIHNFKEIKEVYVYIVSQIGKPINEPQILDIKIRCDNIKIFEKEVNKIAQKHLNNLSNLWKDFIENKINIL